MRRLLWGTGFATLLLAAAVLAPFPAGAAGVARGPLPVASPPDSAARRANAQRALAGVAVVRGGLREETSGLRRGAAQQPIPVTKLGDPPPARGLADELLRVDGMPATPGAQSRGRLVALLVAAAAASLLAVCGFRRWASGQNAVLRGLGLPVED